MLAQLRRGVAWTYTSMAVSIVMQIGVTAATARLLDPDVFGLVAMANALLRFGGYVAEMGVGRALIQRHVIDVHDVRAAFTSSTLLGLTVAGGVVVAAPLAAQFFQAPNVVPVMRWLALTFLLRGFGVTAQALLRRDLRFRGSGAIEITSYALGYVGPTLLLAASGFGVWSLVAGAVGQAAVASSLAYLLTRHAVRPTFDIAVHRRLLGFGSKVSAISFLEFLGSTLDTLVIGRFGTAAQLGLYNRAFMLASLPTYHLHNGIAKVLFPVLSGGQADSESFKVTLRRVTDLSIRIVLPVGIGMALAAPELVGVVLGPQWVDATPLFAVLAIGLAGNLLATFPGIALEALAVLRAKIIVQAGYVLGLAAALAALVLLVGFDLQAIASVIALAGVVRTLAYFAIAARGGAYDPRSLLHHALWAALSVGSAVTLIGVTLLIVRAQGGPPVVRLAAAIASGVVLLGLLFARDLTRWARSRLRSDRVRTKAEGERS